mmetsp:Transcript_22258/g.33652  ORF Transcript_22258/g.33652 Transcript_22258/m.33652 type:complete len:457 (-) Transcript_22258:151-1521(-)|eukprot:CAMPEP_0178938068 /NCGR_PEP_ID=MMETSP0786-20121207/26128_1 /TAXON_ID=186022 /ORGANISM="Thalassionema frauenfeldii, Strain CCMP 1798" /LENGTH=456 /DNA_ID=CAMNT_0020616751 /DNA_START=74 /DNA_END=1444 /DNA_ORIENTATION=-
MSERRESVALPQQDIDALKEIFEKDLSELVEDDGEMSDLLSFTVVMIQNGKTVSEMEQELHDIYGGEYSTRIGALLTTYFEKNKNLEDSKTGQATHEQANNSTGNAPRIKSLKSSREGNALTMSGALGASREGGKSKDALRNKNGNNNDDETPANNDNYRESGFGKKGDRRKNAFDRLTTRESRERRDKRGGRHSGRDNNRGGRGNRSSNGGRVSGFRRGRDEDAEIEEDEDFINTRQRGGRGGRSNFDTRGSGRGRSNRGGRDGGRGGRFARHGRGDSSHKRQRVSDRGEYNGDSKDEYENEPSETDQKNGDFAENEGYGYGYGGGYGNYFGGRGGRYLRSRGRGRGRFGGRGNGPSGETQPAENEEVNHNGDGEQEEGNGTEGANGPNLSYSGRGYGRGRGYRGGRGRAFYRGGRGHVANMIASKSWVRAKKDEGSNAVEPSADEVHDSTVGND